MDELFGLLGVARYLSPKAEGELADFLWHPIGLLIMALGAGAIVLYAIHR